MTRSHAQPSRIPGPCSHGLLSQLFVAFHHAFTGPGD
jgi:hypothetical protein